MKHFAFLSLLCCIASACQTGDVQEQHDQSVPQSITKPASETRRADPTPDEFLNAAARINAGMTEANVRQILGKFEYSGILGSHGIHVPEFWDRGHSTMDLQIAFHNPPASLYPVVAWISDEVTLHINGKHYRYSLTNYRHDVAQNAVPRPLSID